MIRFIGKGQGSTINAANAGSVEAIVLGDSGVFEAQNGGATIDFVNDGTISNPVLKLILTMEQRT